MQSFAKDDTQILSTGKSKVEQIENSIKFVSQTTRQHKQHC